MIGKLALEFCNKALPLDVIPTPQGWFIGTHDDDGPCSRESAEYWRREVEALRALVSGKWTQRLEP